MRQDKIAVRISVQRTGRSDSRQQCNLAGLFWKTPFSSTSHAPYSKTFAVKTELCLVKARHGLGWVALKTELGSDLLANNLKANRLECLQPTGRTTLAICWLNRRVPAAESNCYDTVRQRQMQPTTKLAGAGTTDAWAHPTLEPTRMKGAYLFGFLDCWRHLSSFWTAVVWNSDNAFDVGKPMQSKPVGWAQFGETQDSGVRKDICAWQRHKLRPAFRYYSEIVNCAPSLPLWDLGGKICRGTRYGFCSR